MSIKKITIVSKTGAISHEVGVDGVVAIKDHTIEWENSVDFIFGVFGKDEKRLFEIINCPVEIESK